MGGLLIYQKCINTMLVRGNKKVYYEVEKILDHRGTQNNKEYLVRWKGYDSEEDS